MSLSISKFSTFRPFFNCMKPIMLTIIKNFKIANMIISFIKVNMMNMLSRFKFSSKMFFHYQSVFINLFTFSYRKNYISTSVNSFTASPIWVTFKIIRQRNIFVITFFRTILTFISGRLKLNFTYRTMRRLEVLIYWNLTFYKTILNIFMFIKRCTRIRTEPFILFFIPFATPFTILFKNFRHIRSIIYVSS